MRFEPWRAEAACRNKPPRLFFPPSEDPYSRQRNSLYDYARMICAGCPVREACLDFALRSREQHGLWGGLAPEERRQLLRQGLSDAVAG